MVLSEELEIIKSDIERVCGNMHRLTPFQLMMISEDFSSPMEDHADDMADFVYEQSMRQGPDNLYELGVKHYFGSDGIEKKLDTALTYFAMAGSLRHIPAMVNTGMMFLNGEGTEPNFVESFYWFVMAANEENERGFYFLADFYMTGRGVVEIDHGIAAELYAKSAARGSVPAMFNLGVLKLHGDGVEENYDEALILIQTAASRGFQPAIDALKG